MTGRLRASTDFSSVDLSSDPAAHIGYLDAASALESTAAYKQRMLQLLAPLPGLRVLDVGCGTGEDVLALAELVMPGGWAVGVDASETMVAEARRRATNAGTSADFHVGDAQDLPFPKNAFDCCRLDRTLQHVDEPATAFGELVRVARPGARIVVCEPDWGTLVVDARDRALTRRILNAQCDRIRNGWIGRQLVSLFVGAGLELIEVAPVSLVLRDLAIATQMLNVGVHSTGNDGDSISSAEADGWQAELAAAAATGRFFCAITLFIVAGEKSAP